MAKYTTRKRGAQAKAQTVQRRKIRAAKAGAVRTTRSGRIAR